jgi:AcrR family transcriptional regulator
LSAQAEVAGRRDRKKNETRQALRDAAHRLFAEKGFSRTTIDDITEAANVSRRTFFRYYDSKDDLLRSDVSDMLPVMLAALRSRPADEPPFAAILASLRTLIGPDGPPAIARSLADPVGGFRARLSMIRLLAAWETGIADTLLAREGVGAPSEEDRLRATVTACAATSALRAAAQIYRGRYPGRGLETGRLLPIIEQAFAVLLAPALSRQERAVPAKGLPPLGARGRAPFAGEQLERADPVLVPVGDAGDEHLIGRGRVLQDTQVLGHRLR